MTAFLRVWRFTRPARLIGGSRTVSLAGSEWGLPNRAMFRQGPSACGFRPAGLPEGSGLKPLSARAGARLCVSSEGVLPDSNRRPIAFHAMALPTELKTRIPTSACAPRSLRRLLGHEIRHADCLSPTGYSTECKDAGLPPEPRHSARGRSLVRLALPRTARCPSRLAMSVSRIAPPRVLSRARIPNRSWCVSRATSAHRFCRYPRRFPARTRGPGLPGRTEPESPARRHGERPFPAVADGYPAPGRHPTPAEAEGDCPFGRSRLDESVCPDRRAGARRGNPRLPRPTRSAAPTHHTIPVVKEHPSGQ